MSLIKPKRLAPGSTIAIVSPSSGLPHLFPEHYELGLKNLREIMGFRIIEMPSARMAPDDLYRNPRLRADDLNRCFADEQIDGILTSIGGYESVRILPYLDTAAILRNPKFIMGFSDASTFLCHLNRLGMVTFYGPSVMAGFAQLEHLPREFTQHLQSFLFSDRFPYAYAPYARWTNGYQDWSNLGTLGQCQTFYNNDEGWTFVQGCTAVQGRLWGGCIEVLEFMKSTAYWPDAHFWNDKILFFETSEEKPLPAQLGYMLRNYGMQGVFQQIKGVLFGRAKDYSQQEKEQLNGTIVAIIRDEFGAGELPVAVDVDFGHTDPKLILPLGGTVRLDPQTKEIAIVESPFGD